MKRNILITLLVFNTAFCFGQNAKNVGWYIQELHYPEIKLPSDYKTFGIKIQENNSSIRLIDNGEQKTTSFKNPNISDFVNNLIELPGFSKSENPDLILEFNDSGVKHILSVTEKRAYGKDAKNTFTGIVELSSVIELKVKNKNDSILYQKKYSKKYKSESAGVYNNFAITSKNIALSQIKKQYNANARDYRYSKNLNIANDIVREISSSLKSLFSSYYEAKRVNLFQIKKEDKFGIDNNSQVDKLVKMNGLEYSDSYLDNLNKIAEESLDKFMDEIKKIKNVNDKKEKKIYWVLLSNISGVYYALGNYEKAIEYAKKRTEIDYNSKWKYNLEIAESRKKTIEKNKQ